MKNVIARSLWVSFTIWLCAVLVNAFIGSIVLIGTIDLEMLQVGALFGAVFSFPVLLAIMIVLYCCISTLSTSELIIKQVFATGLIMTIVVFIAFIFLFSVYGSETVLLFIGTLASATLSISIHINVLRKLGSDYHISNFSE